MHQRTWISRALSVAALFNLALAALLIIAPDAVVVRFGYVPALPAAVRVAGVLFGALGVGYAVAAGEPRRHWAVVLVGLIGNILTAGAFVWSIATAEGPPPALWIATAVEIAWIGIFVRILRAIAAAHTAEEGEPEPAPRDRLLLRYTAQNGLTLYEQSLERPLLTIFLRHAGCTFCRETLGRVSALRREIEAGGAGLAFVTMSDGPEAEKIFRRYGLEDVPRFVDPSCELYRAFELPRGGWSTMFAPSVWKRGLRAALLEGHGAGRVQGDAFRMPGVFLLYRGRVTKSYRHRSPADHPDYVELARRPELRDERFGPTDLAESANAMTTGATWVFIANFTATLLMTGAIWVIQIVHYPLFAAVGETSFPEYERRHIARITWVVGPLMLVELASATAFWVISPESLKTAAAAGLALLAVIWISTALLQGPYHAALAREFNRAIHGRLVRTNWIRTAGWSVRSAIVVWIAARLTQ